MDLKIQNSLLHIEPSLTRTHKHLILSLSSEEGANMKNEFMQMSNNPTEQSNEIVSKIKFLLQLYKILR